MERSGQSLRSFYQYFAGKYELLLALFEESVRSTAEHLAADRRRASRTRSSACTSFLVEYYRICTPTPKGKPAKKARPTPAIAEFAQQLLTEHPKEAAGPSCRSSTLLEGLLDDAAAAGALRAEPQPPPHRGRPAAGDHVQRLRLDDQRHARSRRAASAEELWDLVLHGIAAR